jgi:hypothetical protein
MIGPFKKSRLKDLAPGMNAPGSDRQRNEGSQNEYSILNFVCKIQTLLSREKWSMRSGK